MIKKKPLAKKPEKAVFDKSQPVYIVSGSNLPAGFDFGLLKGKQCIALSTVYRQLKSADVMFFTKIDFYNRCRDSLPVSDFWRFNGKVYTTIKALSSHPRIKTVSLPASSGMSEGANSILLAKKLGAETVILIGFDCQGDEPKSETLINRKACNENSKQRDKEFTSINKLKHGLTIINADVFSDITCFNKVDLDSYLNLKTNKEL